MQLFIDYSAIAFLTIATICGLTKFVISFKKNRLFNDSQLLNVGYEVSLIVGALLTVASVAILVFGAF
jgi:hypothetical protein